MFSHFITPTQFTYTLADTVNLSNDQEQVVIS